MVKSLRLFAGFFSCLCSDSDFHNILGKQYMEMRKGILFTVKIKIIYALYK